MAAFKALGATVNIDVGATTANVALGQVSPEVRVMNNGTATAWIAWGGSAVAGVLATSIPVGPGVTEVFGIPVGATYAAAIAAGSTGKIYFTPGIGV